MPDAVLPEGIHGYCHPHFSSIPMVVAQQLASGAHHGVAVAVRHRGDAVVDIWGGRRGADGAEAPWTEDTLVLSFSTTKGPSAAALHMAVERAGLSYDTPVAGVWPEFGANGKEAVTIRHVLCHEAGVPQIRGECPDVWCMSDWEQMVAMMEGLAPLWEPGTTNGYHAINYGWLVGELVRRIDGRPFSTFLAEEIAGPLGLDGFYIGTPESEHHRVAPVRPDGAFVGANLEALLPPDHLLLRALAPEGDMTAFVNSAQGLSTCGPAFTGVFAARDLATFYAALERGGSLGGVFLLSPDTLATATTVQNTRPDLVLFLPIRWRLGFMSGGSGISPAGPHPNAYGHSGYGGSLGMVDPQTELAIAVLFDRLEANLLGDQRARSVVEAAIAAVDAA